MLDSLKVKHGVKTSSSIGSMGMTSVQWSTLALSLGLFLGPELQAQHLVVPTGDGRPVMTDGVFASGEWEDAHRVSIGETVYLHVKEHMGHVFIGVDCGELGKPFVVNLFIGASGGEIHELHASAQIGERVLSPEGQEDPHWIWGSSPGWYANEVRWNQPMAQSLMEDGVDRDEAQRQALFKYQGFEFQILRSKFREKEWVLRVEVLSSPDFDVPLVYPTGTLPKNPEGWLRLSLPSVP